MRCIYCRVISKHRFSWNLWIIIINLLDKGWLEFACLYSSKNYPSNLKARSYRISNLLIWYLGDESFTPVHHLHPSGQGFSEVGCSLISKLFIFETTGLWELTKQQSVENKYSRPQTFGRSLAHKHYVGFDFNSHGLFEVINAAALACSTEVKAWKTLHYWLQTFVFPAGTSCSELASYTTLSLCPSGTDVCMLVWSWAAKPVSSAN